MSVLDIKLPKLDTGFVAQKRYRGYVAAENRMGLSNNKERQAWWQAMNRVYSKEQINEAISTLPPDMQQVIRLHYEQGISLQEIAHILKRSMTAIRTRQVMGIYKLWQYFGKPNYLFTIL